MSASKTIKNPTDKYAIYSKVVITEKERNKHRYKVTIKNGKIFIEDNSEE